MGRCETVTVSNLLAYEWAVHSLIQGLGVLSFSERLVVSRQSAKPFLYHEQWYVVQQKKCLRKTFVKKASNRNPPKLPGGWIWCWVTQSVSVPPIQSHPFLPFSRALDWWTVNRAYYAKIDIDKGCNRIKRKGVILRTAQLMYISIAWYKTVVLMLMQYCFNSLASGRVEWNLR